MNATSSRTFAFLMLASMLLATAGCGGGSSDPSEVSKQNFARVIDEHLKEEGACLGMKRSNLPKMVAKDELAYRRMRPFHDALVGAGVLAKKDTMVPRRYLSPEPGVAYDVAGGTDAFDEEGRLCYGTPRVTEVTNYTEPTTSPGASVKVARVNYEYVVEDLPEWARREDVQSARSKIARWAGADSEPKEEQEALVLSGDGWVHQSEFSR